MIRRWERGNYRRAERYELLYSAVLGVRPEDLRGQAAPVGNPRGPRPARAQCDGRDRRGTACGPGSSPPMRARRFSATCCGRGSCASRRSTRARQAAYRPAARRGQRPGDPAGHRTSTTWRRRCSKGSARTRWPRWPPTGRSSGQAGRQHAAFGAAKLRVANAYLAASRHAEAVAVAAAAADDLPPGRNSAPEEIATFGSLLLTAAVAAAEMGEAAQAWEFLGHARAATAFYHRDHADLYAVFGPVNLAVHGVQVATELGDGREALRRAERTDPGRLPAVLLERRTTLLIDMARAQHMRRDNAAAGETLLEAERIAPLEVRYSGAARGLLGELLSTGRPSGELRQMADRLNWPHDQPRPVRRRLRRASLRRPFRVRHLDERPGLGHVRGRHPIRSAVRGHGRARGADQPPRPFGLQAPRGPRRPAPGGRVRGRPLTFNTVNKWANGITDTLALGLLNEALGAGRPDHRRPQPAR